MGMIVWIYIRCGHDCVDIYQVVRLVVAGGTVGAMEQLTSSGAYSRLQQAAMHPIK